LAEVGPAPATACRQRRSGNHSPAGFPPSPAETGFARRRHRL